ncbi:MAG: ATP-dependent helicase HrpB [Gammaproteobacteria bacterium]
MAEVLPALKQALATHTRLVLEAPPGAGKTTQVPLALLDEPWCRNKKVLMLEPRRVAARAAASFMAKQLHESVGATVGYRIRFENKVSSATRVEVVTEGILTRMIQDDPTLDGVGAILFDEFHERHLAGDLGLALALDVQTGLREDLRLVVMSATLDGEKLTRFLDAERITSAGRSFPVTTRHFAAKRDEALQFHVKRCIEHVLAQHPGDVLVFLPGQREIGQVENALSGAAFQALDVIALYGDMPIEKQSAALAPSADGRRRVILATNLAESSVTLPGVRVVIDSGLAREPRFDPNSGFSRLETVYISQASADQRAGRAGRVAEGWCYRLWANSQRLDATRTPEIFTVDLAGLALELAAWGGSDLRFVDTPPPGTFAAAQGLLRSLGALDAKKRITPFGTRMLKLGTHPRLAAMLLAPRDVNEQALACDLAALVEARDPLIAYRGDDWQARWDVLMATRPGKTLDPGLRRGDDGSPASGRARPDEDTPSSFRRRPESSVVANAAGVSRAALSAIAQSATQWRKRLRIDAAPKPDTSARTLGDVLLHAYPDRIARQHPADRYRYQLSNGRSARLADDSRLIGEPWLVISELRHENKDSLVLRAAPLDESRLREEFPERFVEQDIVRWDEQSRALVARRETRYEQIVLASKPAGKADAEQAAQALSDAVANYGLASLPWSDALQQWRTRVNCLREWMPELKLPDLSDAALLATRAEWLKPAFVGKTRLDTLSESELASALKALLDWNQQQLVDTHAPARISVPSGLERAIEYHEGAAPVLAVKLQELFGLGETPRIANGRVPLTLHLLSPGGKPLQITQDLKSFWERTYPEVKKEMKGRYPRHPWPDDPWSATATHRAKPRGT